MHESAGASNPLGVAGYYDRIPFAPYYLFKDLITIFIFIFVLSIFVFFMPNVLGDSENYIMANPMQTPAAIAIISQISKNLLEGEMSKDQLLKILNDNKEIKDKDENFRWFEGHVFWKR